MARSSEGPAAPPFAGRPAGEGPPAKRLSMHEGIAVWCDCCSCEAEPYWAEVAGELGIDLGGDYEAEVPAGPSTADAVIQVQPPSGSQGGKV